MAISAGKTTDRDDSGSTGGYIALTTGYSRATSSGHFKLLTPNAGAKGVSGDVHIETGTASDGATGQFTLKTGASTAGHGGDISLSVGTGDKGDGGNVVLRAGDTSA